MFCGFIGQSDERMTLSVRSRWSQPPSPRGRLTPPVAYGDRFPFLSPAVTSSPGAGEVGLWDGAFGMAGKFPAKPQSARARQRLPPRGSWQNRQALTEGVRPPQASSPSQALPRQLPQRGSQAVKFITKVLGAMRNLPAVLLPLPLGEVARHKP